MNISEKLDRDLLHTKLMAILKKENYKLKKIAIEIGMGPIALNSFIRKNRKPTLATLLRIWTFVEKRKK